MAGGRNEVVEKERRAEIARYMRSVFERSGYNTQAELAHDVGVEASRVSHWLDESGEGRGASAFNLLQVIRAVERRKPGSSAIVSDAGRLDLRLQRLEVEVEFWKELLLEALALLGLQVNLEADQGSRVRRSTGR